MGGQMMDAQDLIIIKKGEAGVEAEDIMEEIEDIEEAIVTRIEVIAVACLAEVQVKMRILLQVTAIGAKVLSKI